METTSQPQVTAEALASFVREVNASTKKLAIYPTGHPASIKAAEKPFSMLEEILRSGGRVILAVAEGKLVGNGMPLDDRLLMDGLGKAIYESGLASITFEPGVEFDGFEKFLAHLNLKKEQRDLQGLIDAEGIVGIGIGKVQYQLVNENERVVSADAAENLGDMSAGSVQSTVAEALRKHPALLLQLLSRGHYESEKTDDVQAKTTEGSKPSSIADTVNARAIHSFAADGDLAPVVQELSGCSNEELLGLLVTALRESLADRTNTTMLQMTQTLFTLREVLAQREALDLLPKLQQALADLNIADPRYIELILAADSSPRKIAYTQIQNIKEEFAKGTIATERLDELQGWLETINDGQYTDDVIKGFYQDAEARDYKLSESQLSMMTRLAMIGAQQFGTALSDSQLRQIKDRIAEPSVTQEAFELLANQLEQYYLKFLEAGNYSEAQEILGLICQKFDTELIYTEGVAEYASQVHQRMTSAKITESLVYKLSRHFDAVSKMMTPLLEMFFSVEAILVFASYIANDNRGVRVLLIRLLSGFGVRTVNAFRVLLSDRTLTTRGAVGSGQNQDTWYRLRNIIFVLGNIPHPDSVSMVKHFTEDKEARVVLEATSALERLGGAEAATTCAQLLSHPAKEVRQRALHALMTNNSTAQYEYVEEYFVRNVEERSASMPALIKLDSKRAFSFLGSVLLGDSEIYAKYHDKPNEELNETIVSTLIQLRSTVFDEVMRKYVRDHTRTLLGHFRKPDSVKIAERYFRTTSSGL